MIIVSDYDPEWPSWFDQLREVLWPAVGTLALTIEHVGSTSVPGLPAKPVIDLDVVVTRENVGPAVGALAELGYVHRGNLGIVDREAFWNPPESMIAHHLYVCVEGASSLRNHLAVRDALRANDDLRHEYAELKRALVARVDGIDAYVEGKSDFLGRVLASAGFRATELGAIAAANRAR